MKKSIQRLGSLLFLCILAWSSSCAKPYFPVDNESEILQLCENRKMTRIHAVQGSAHRSPMENQVVTCITGIVTAISGQGFYLQDLIEDENENTSEAIFVVYSVGNIIKPGDRVFIHDAKVEEFNPSINRSNSLTITRLTGAHVQVVSRNNPLPPPVVLGESGRQIPTEIIENDVNGYIGKNHGLFDPEQDGMDFFESLESMYVEVQNALTVSSTNRYKEITIVADLGKNGGVFADTGVLTLREFDQNPERILLDDTFIQMPDIALGTRLLSPVRGIIGYDFSNYRLMPLTQLSFETSLRSDEIAERPSETGLSIASYNVENLSAADQSERFIQLANDIVNGLGSPDIIVLQEILDNDGALMSKIVSAELTIKKISEAVLKIGGPRYLSIQIDPEKDADGGLKGGNGRVVIFYRDDTGLEFSSIPGADARTEVKLQEKSGKVVLSKNPGRIWPQNSCFRNSRKALIAQFRYENKSLFVIAVHFSSKGEDGALYGEIQPPPNPSEGRRIAQAKAVNGFVKRILQAEPNARIVVLGDINDFYWSESVKTLMGDQLKNSAMIIQEHNRYTYIHEGNGQMMDQIFLSEALYTGLIKFQAVHLNTSQFEEDALSDHDPVIIFLKKE